MIQNLKIENPVGSGIRMGGPQIRVQQCEVIGANVFGIYLFGNGVKVSGCTVKNIAKMSRLNSKGLGDECCSGRGINIS